MTIEEAKEELRRYKYDQDRIDEALEDIERLKDRAMKTTSTLSSEPHSASVIQDKLAEIIAMYVDKAQEMSELTKQMIQHQKQVEQKIAALPQPYQNILYYTYQKGYTLTKTAAAVGYEYIYTTELHGKALKLYAKLK